MESTAVCSWLITIFFFFLNEPGFLLFHLETLPVQLPKNLEITVVHVDPGESGHVEFNNLVGDY